MQIQSFSHSQERVGSWELSPQQRFLQNCSEVDIIRDPRRPLKEIVKKSWLKTYALAFNFFVLMNNVVLNAVKETGIFLGRLKKVVVISAESFSKFGTLFKRLGILSVFSLFFSLKKIPSHARKFLEQLKLRDKEGVVMGFAKIAKHPLEALEALASLLGGLSAFGMIPAIAFFSLISLPLSVVLLGLEAVTNIYKTIQRSLFLKRLPPMLKEDSEKEREKILEYINQTIGFTDKDIRKIAMSKNSLKTQSNLAKRKAQALIRRNGKEVYQITCKIKADLEEKAEKDTINFSLKSIRMIIAKKILLKSVVTVSRIGAIALGIILTLILPLPFSAFALPTVAILFCAISIGSRYYEHLQNKTMKASLKNLTSDLA